MKGDTYKDLYGYNYRLGYQLAKEYNKYLLFRYACPANGPCNFVIINKTTGSTVKKFSELIYDHYDGGKFYKFILYFSNPNRFNYLTLYYVDSKKKYFIPINAKDINGAIPEYTFYTVELKDNKLKLEYPHLKTNRWVKKKCIY